MCEHHTFAVNSQSIDPKYTVLLLGVRTRGGGEEAPNLLLTVILSPKIPSRFPAQGLERTLFALGEASGEWWARAK